MDLQKTMDGVKPDLNGVPLAELANIVLDVRYKTSTGDVLSGPFEFKHPNLGDEGDIAVMRSSFARVPWESLSPADRDMFTAISGMNILLVNKPPWYDLSDPRIGRDLPVGIYGAFLEKRQAMFRAGRGGGEGEAGKPALEIVPRDGIESSSVTS